MGKAPAREAKESERQAAGGHFDTEHLMGDLVQRSARGSVVTVSAQAVKFLLQTGSTMALARLLTPADFGLLAMVAFFTGIIGLFGDLGLSAATVQRKQISHSQVSTLFWVNIAVSIVLMLAAAAAAPFVAWFYGEGALLWVTIVISMTYLWGGLAAQHLALLRRQMRFTALASVEICALLFGVAAGISVALLGGGYWALVAVAVGQAFATAVLAFALSGWRPGRWRIDETVKQMILFGGNITGARFLNYITRNSDNLLIGRFWGASELGIYSRAYALLLLPVQQINGPIAGVAIPALSRLQSKPDEYRRYYLKVVQSLAYMSMPVVVMLAVLAEEVVLLVLGSQWLDAAIIFQIFAAFVIVQNVVVTTGWVLQSLGRGSRMLKWSAVQAPVFVIACLIGLPWGGIGVAIAATIQALLITVPCMLFAYRDSPVSVLGVGKAVLKPVCVAAGLFLIASGAYIWAIDLDTLVRVGVVVGAAVAYGMAVLLVFETVREDVLAVRRVLKR